MVFCRLIGHIFPSRHSCISSGTANPAWPSSVALLFWQWVGDILPRKILPFFHAIDGPPNVFHSHFALLRKMAQVCVKSVNCDPRATFYVRTSWRMATELCDNSVAWRQWEFNCTLDSAGCFASFNGTGAAKAGENETSNVPSLVTPFQLCSRGIC